MKQASWLGRNRRKAGGQVGTASRSAMSACVLVLVFLGVPTLHAAPPVVSQFVGLTGPVVDEFGEVLQGNDPDSQLFGHTHVEGDVVQVLLTTDGNIYPPDIFGNPHPNNVVLQTTKIGLGVSAFYEQPGFFAAAVPRPAEGSYIFIRVFNNSTLEESTFYGDSEKYRVTWQKLETFHGTITGTSHPIDSNDDDGDGINNSWERSYVQRDGVSSGGDPEETQYGFPVDIRRLLPILQNHLYIEWDAEPGTTYVVECTTAGMGGKYHAVREIVAETEIGQALIPWALNHEMACYRICMVHE